MRTRKQKSTFKNISETITLLIDMYYYRRRLIKRYRSIKYYQRHGKLKTKHLSYSENLNKELDEQINKSAISKGDIHHYQTAGEIAVEKGLVKSEIDFYESLSKEKSRLPDKTIDFFRRHKIEVKINYISSLPYDLFKFDITYKNYKQRFQFSDLASDDFIHDSVKRFINECDIKIEENKKQLAKKNNPHNLKVGNQYYINYKFNDFDNYIHITIIKITDDGFPWAQGLPHYNGIITPNMYDIKDINHKLIHNCSQWDKFQAKKRLNEGYELSELDKKHLKDKGVVYQFWLSHEKGKHSSLRIYYKSRVNLHIFYNKPLRIDVFNTIQSYMNQIDQEESVALRRKQLEERNDYISYIESSPGIDTYNPLKFTEIKPQLPW